MQNEKTIELQYLGCKRPLHVKIKVLRITLDEHIIMMMN